MPRFAANLSFLYQDLDFLNRFQAAAEDGFLGVEYLFPYDHAAETIAAHLQQHGLTQVLFNAPPGDWAAGERGIASLPGREDEFKRGIEKALAYAGILGNKFIHVMAGLLPEHADRAKHYDTYLHNLAYSANEAAAHSINILIEPINLRDMPGYFLNHQNEAHDICAQIGASNLKVQADLYHAQIMDGDLSVMLEQCMSHIGHIQIASVPGRNEPDLGEINYAHLFRLIDSLSYTGWIGCEYKPKSSTREGLAWRDKLTTQP